MTRYHAKKRLGQNFLKSDTVISDIIDIIKPAPGQRIIEIGPGRGALTLPLAQSGADVIAVEFDRDLIGYLTKLLDKYENVQLVNQDFLTYEPPPGNFAIIGNLPFNIATPVFEWAVSHRQAITRACLMVQKEVADRLASSPGSKDWSPLAIFTQLQFDITDHFDVAPKHFSPPPKVTSTVIELTPRPSVDIKHYDAFEKLVRAAFTQRRKTLLNNLVPGIAADRQTALEILENLAIPDRARAESLSTQLFLELTNLLVERNILTT